MRFTDYILFNLSDREYIRVLTDNTNNVSLFDLRIYRNRKRKDPEYGKQDESFGTPSVSPASKKGRKHEDSQV